MARALFQEFTPAGALPVSVDGINYDLITRTAPDPRQVIQVQLADKRIRELRVADIVHVGNTVPAAFGNQLAAFVSPATLEWLGGGQAYTQVVLTVAAEKRTDQAYITSLAEEVGLKSGDLILSLNGTALDGNTSLLGLIRGCPADSRITLQVQDAAGQQNVLLCSPSACSSN